MRITLIDGFRGIFLIFMMIMHANMELKAIVGKINHHYFGWVEDAQGFVFLSGLVVGLVYSGRMLHKGDAAMHSAVWQRIRTIYSHQAGLILIFLAVALMLGPSIKPMVLTPYQSEPVVFTAASLLLVTASSHMGILPMYILFMMFTPFVLRRLAQGQFAMIAVLSVSLWLLGQTGLTELLATSAELLAAQAGHPIRFGIFFNPLGWQIVFFSGLAIGYLMASNKLDTSFLSTPDMEKAFFVALAAIFALGLFDRLVFDFWISRDFSKQVLSSVDRGNFSTLYLVAFCLDLFVIVWLLGPGRTSRFWIIAATARLLHRVCTFRPLVFLGQHSLHVFSAHILCIYALTLVLQGTTPPPLTGNVLLLLSPVPLFLAALGHAYITRDKRADVGTPRSSS